MNDKNLNIGILGFGEVGQAIAKFYSNPKIKDLNRDDGLLDLDVLHICIPYGKNFIKIVRDEIKRSDSKLTIIHSSVAPGVTKKIGGMTVHSPVRGVHPNLHLGIKTFIKFIGADSKKSAQLANAHLKSIGIKTKIIYPSISTEMGKLFDTTYYGMCIAWHGEMKKICDQLNIDFNDVSTKFNASYNQGYKKLGKTNVIRPVLYYPQDNIIGGHCVIPNAKILKNSFKSKVFDLILDYSSDSKK